MNTNNANGVDGRWVVRVNGRDVSPVIYHDAERAHQFAQTIPGAIVVRIS